MGEGGRGWEGEERGCGVREAGRKEWRVERVRKVREGVLLKYEGVLQSRRYVCY